MDIEKLVKELRSLSFSSGKIAGLLSTIEGTDKMRGLGECAIRSVDDAEASLMNAIDELRGSREVVYVDKTVEVPVHEGIDAGKAAILCTTLSAVVGFVAAAAFVAIRGL